MSESNIIQHSAAYTYSQAYFVFKGRYQELCSQGKAEDVGGITGEINQALQKGEISRAEYDDLMRSISLRGCDVHSEEYTRLRRVIDSMAQKKGVLSSASQEELKEEVALAQQHGMLSDAEVADLMSTIGSAPSKVIDLAQVQTANNCPQRQRAAKRRAQHSEGFDEMWQEFKNLHTEEAIKNSEVSTRKFFKKLADAYKEGRITVKEYRDFHGALGDKMAFLDEIEIDTSCRAFGEFRERCLDLFSNDTQIEEIIIQVCMWALKRGEQAAAVMADIYSVAMRHLDAFYKSGAAIYTVSYREKAQSRLMEMKLS